MHSINPDLSNSGQIRINFGARHEYTDITAPCNLVVEVRKSDPAVQDSLKSVAWTMFALFDPAGDLNYGKWRAPMFTCPTKLQTDIETIAQEPGFSGIDLAIRIGAPGNKKEEAFKS